MNFSWMAWTLPTTLFFLTILALLIAMSVWEYFSPGGSPRTGVLRFETTRGDRLFGFAAGQRFHSSCMAWARWAQPVVGSCHLRGLRHRRLPLRVTARRRQMAGVLAA